jgi:hypothetical protein
MHPTRGERARRGRGRQAPVRGENLNEYILVPMARPTYGSEVPPPAAADAVLSGDWQRVVESTGSTSASILVSECRSHNSRTRDHNDGRKGGRSRLDNRRVVLSPVETRLSDQLFRMETERAARKAAPTTGRRDQRKPFARRAFARARAPYGFCGKLGAGYSSTGRASARSARCLSIPASESVPLS